MFGVVIWSDLDEGKAVIWCEDHGDLAFYRQENLNCIVEMDPGDLVQFDLKLDRSQRIACNPRLIAEGVYDGLSGQLSSARASSLGEGHAATAPGAESKVVAFDRYHGGRNGRGGQDDLSPTRQRNG